MLRALSTLSLLLTTLLLAATARSGEVSVAVASNFATAMSDLAAPFERETGHRLRHSGALVAPAGLRG